MTGDSRRFHLLVNAAAGGGRAPAAVVPVARLLREAGASVRVTYSTGPRACRHLAAESVRRREVVVAVGGDGMVSSLAGTVAGHDGLLGLLPCGRGNDFARQLGLAARPDPQAAAHRLLTAAPRPVDLIDVAGRVVVGSVYAGVDSLASELVDRAHRLPAAVQYPYAAVRALLTFTPTRFRVDVDGACHEQEAFTVVVASSGYYGSGMHVAPGAVPDDGVLDVVVVRAASRLRLLRCLPRIYDGTHVGLPEVLVLRGRAVRVESDGPVTAYADGERLADLPVTATVRPAALRVLA